MPQCAWFTRMFGFPCTQLTIEFVRAWIVETCCAVLKPISTELGSIQETPDNSKEQCTNFRKRILSSKLRGSWIFPRLIWVSSVNKKLITSGMISKMQNTRKNLKITLFSIHCCFPQHYQGENQVTSFTLWFLLALVVINFHLDANGSSVAPRCEKTFHYSTRKPTDTPACFLLRI